MATEDAVESLPSSAESVKFFVPTEKEEKKLDLKKIILISIGYASLIFALLALFFPMWIDHSTGSFLNLWQINPAGIPLWHWEILWYYDIFLPYIYISVIALVILCILLYILIRRCYNLVMHDWREPNPGTSYFTFCIIILLAIIPAAFFLPEFMVSDPMVSAPYTVLYGPSWGLAFGWYALLLAGILGFTYSKLKENFEKPKEEDWKSL